MFQEWVSEDKRGVISGAQNGVQNVFDCVHFGIVFVWPTQCHFGHAMILTALMMIGTWGSPFLFESKSTYVFFILLYFWRILRDFTGV